ncbi:hypothetical protein ACFYNM_17595 [Streptomyces spororaveus]|uniref:hypothetical protein n=1 Tax=Streptomyces spororaveus TaxID=284039 RepID=UPI0036B39C8A
MLALGGVVCLLATGWGAYRLWNGEPYPDADPQAVATRLGAQAERVRDDLAVPVPADALPGRADTGACSYRGLRSVAHIDESRPDVRSFSLAWQTTGVPEETARAAERRVRLRLARQGWRLTAENISDMGFRYEDPGTGDRVDVDWYEPTGTLAARVHAPCGKVPGDHPG